MSHWIKMRLDLDDDPAVISIAARTGLDEFAVIGRLQNLWSWADRQATDGHAAGVTTAWINRRVRHDKFAEAMIDVGWLLADEAGVTFPNFDRHNGESAKNRAMAADRKRVQRARDAGQGDGHEEGTPASRGERDEGVTREDKRRRDKEERENAGAKPGRNDYPVDFENAWTAYPARPGNSKADAFKAWSARRKDGVAPETMLAGVLRYRAYVQGMRTEPQYVKQAATFFGPGGHYDSEWVVPQRARGQHDVEGTDYGRDGDTL